MDEIQLMRRLVPDAPLREAGDLAEARRRLAAAIDGSDRRPARLPRPGRRFVTMAWAAGAVAVVVVTTGVLVLAPDRLGGQLPAANAEAAQVLHRAAAAALTLPDVEPRPDQFVYQRDADGAETWLSADGTRDGLRHNAGGADRAVLDGCREGQRTVRRGDDVVGTEPCAPDPAYLPDLPTDADAMLAHLYRESGGRPGDANALGKHIFFLLNGHYLRPGARAALFEAAARVPGLRVVDHARDAAGRPGIGVAWEAEGRSGMIVFDATTYALLGVWAGQGGSAVAEVGVVDEVGQRP